MLDYLRFLAAWYNLPFLGMVAAGLAVGLLRRSPTPEIRPSAALLLFAAGITGLTLNGAIHDFRLGAHGRWFPLVLTVSPAVGWGVARLAVHLRRRVFPPVARVTFDLARQEGREVVVLSASIAPGASGRARYRDDDGVVHVVRVYLPVSGEATSARFGRTMRLGPFDDSHHAYRLDRM